jgi:hypothetical protein
MLVMPLVGMGRAPAALVTDLGMDVQYAGTQAGSATSVTVTISPNGTWSVTFGGGDTPSGTPTSGFWLQGGGVGTDYEVQFVKTNELNSPGGVNDAAAFTPVTGALTASVTKTAADASADVAINIRLIGASSTALTESTNLAANGA